MPQRQDARQVSDHAANAALQELVMGLHWDPSAPGADPANLDALCLALDAQGQVLETVHPRRTRNANGSIVHTGDSPAGASWWDDERIFVFLEALPAPVATLQFAVSSVDGRTFDAVAGASCHVSDRESEHEWIRMDLTALGAHRACRVATLTRAPDGWRIAADAAPLDSARLAQLVDAPDG